MPDVRTRLDDAQVAALARHHFDLLPGPPQLPPGAEFEDAQGVLLAVREADEVRVVEVPRWQSPLEVRERMQAMGSARPAAWIGLPPLDPSSLPAQVLALLPSGGLAADSATTSAGTHAWAGVRATGRDVLVVPVPVTTDAPELPWEELAAGYGADLLGVRVETGAARTGGTVVFCTGLSGAGKSTIAARLVELLIEEGCAVTLLDGDEVRHHLSSGLGFSRADRDTNVRRIGWVAARIAKHGGIAVCAPIAPYADIRADVRREVESQAGTGSFLLVHVATSLADCEARDRKGLYAKARAGEIPAFTGISDPYETPTDAEVTVETSGRTVDACARQVLDRVLGR